MKVERIVRGIIGTKPKSNVRAKLSVAVCKTESDKALGLITERMLLTEASAETTNILSFLSIFQ